MGPRRRTLLTLETDAVVIAVRASPKSSRDAILGTVETPQGQALKIAVAAPADRGKANAAVSALVARAFQVPKSAVTVIAGATDRSKLLRVAGDPATLSKIAEQWNAA